MQRWETPPRGPLESGPEGILSYPDNPGVIAADACSYIAAAYGIEGPEGLEQQLGAMLRSLEERKQYGRMIVGQAWTEQKLHELARQDSMTGLRNKPAWVQEVRWAQAWAADTGRRLAVVELDIDSFKSVNDLEPPHADEAPSFLQKSKEPLGHEIGDAVLKGFAEILRTGTRAGDTPAYIGRLGGDEYGVLLRWDYQPDVLNRTSSMTDEDRARSFITRIQRSFATYAGSYMYAGRSLQEWVPGLGVSAGFALLEPETPLNEALREADQMLLATKRDSRNSISAFGLLAQDVPHA